MIRDGWHDTFTAAAASVGYATAASDIDGWDYQAPRTTQRIDYILTNRSDIRVTRAQTVFDPARGEEAVSDHCGVFCAYGEVGP
jgi:endonuclease/exonuclease/phosphatase family metal-dependent hydrolase